MTRETLGTCDHCDEPAVLGINGFRGCADHIEWAVEEAAERMRAVLAAFDRAFPRG